MSSRLLLRQLLFIVLLHVLFVPSLFASESSRADSTLMRHLAGEGLVSYPVHDVEFFTRGSDKFRSLIDDIDHAQSSIWLEYFIFASDSIGTLVMDHLVQAAARGVEVRVVTDYYKDRERHYGMGSRAFADSLASLGVDFQMYDRFRVLFFNHVTRDHRKIVTIDHRIGYIGGLNIADYYIKGEPDVYGGWRDLHARITGPAVRGLDILFHDLYLLSGGQGVFSVPDIDLSAAVTPSSAAQSEAVFFERSQASRPKKAETRRSIIAALDAARDTIRIVTPYLLPTHTVRQALKRALRRGVHMEVMFSRVGDIDFISSGNYHFALDLVRRGAHVYLVRDDFHHSKVINIDGQVCMVGSANFNSRSFKFDLEASAFLFSPHYTHQLDSIFAADRLNSDILTPAFYRERLTRGFRFKGWFADRFLTPVL